METKIELVAANIRPVVTQLRELRAQIAEERAFQSSNLKEKTAALKPIVFFTPSFWLLSDEEAVQAIRLGCGTNVSKAVAKGLKKWAVKKSVRD